MKKTLITLMLLALTAVAWSQDNKVRIAELDSIGIMQFNNQQYDEALTTFQQELSLIQQEYGENDSLYVDDLAVISRCYFRQKAYKKALETGLKAAEIYGNHYSKDNVYYANLLDNVSLYYSSVDDLANAMVKITGGSFLMGASVEDEYAYYAETPQHQVTVSDFYICKHEVTQELWQAVMDSCPNYKGGWSEAYGKGDKYPAYFISWNDCQLFISKLNEMTGIEFRLPTEAEWEYAARGGNKTKGYCFAGSNNLDNIAWYVKNSEGKNHIVMQKQANELGLYDMCGNVWEWCSDWYGSNYYAESNNSIDPKGPLADTIISSLDNARVIRGGAWDYYPRFCRLSYRNGYYIEDRDCNLGFRLVASPIK